MKALIDADVLRYEIGSIGENNGPDHPEPMHFDRVAEYFDQRVAQIKHAVDADEVQLYLTGSVNFRNDIAVTKPYKGNRKGDKPFHYHNLTAYITATYDTVIEEPFEADDLMCMRQLESEDLLDTVICTRDKDLRMVPGWHYGWECGAQKELHKHWVTYDGTLWENDGKYGGNGMAFFWWQTLVGDTVDNIPGLRGCGPKKAWALLGEAEPHEMYNIVREAYDNDKLLLEQGRLLWMTRQRNPEGGPELWEHPV